MNEQIMPRKLLAAGLQVLITPREERGRQKGGNPTVGPCQGPYRGPSRGDVFLTARYPRITTGEPGEEGARQEGGGCGRGGRALRRVPPRWRERVLYSQSTGPNPLDHRDDLVGPALRHGSCVLARGGPVPIRS